MPPQLVQGNVSFAPEESKQKDAKATPSNGVHPTDLYESVMKQTNNIIPSRAGGRSLLTEAQAAGGKRSHTIDMPKLR